MNELPGLTRPRYERWLGQVVPALATALGAPLDAPLRAPGVTEPLELPATERAVLILLDGLGERALRRSSGHAPFLAALDSPYGPIESGFPSTTATSTTSLGTGLTPGAHGVTGWQSLDPERDRVFNHLSWADGPDPETWQPHPTAFEQLVRAGVAVTRVAPQKFAASGLTRAGLRGGHFVGADSLEARAQATLDAVRQTDGPGLVYGYVGEVDRAGHVHGPDSWQWGAAVEDVDAFVEQICDGLPKGTSLTVVSDHGMVSAPASRSWDLARHSSLATGVRHYGGEPRAPQVFTAPGAAPGVKDRWERELGEAAVVLTREEAVAAGWFGPRVEARVLPRIGDVVAAMRSDHTVVDSRVLRPAVLSLLGQHGSLTPDEVEVPLLHLPG